MTAKLSVASVPPFGPIAPGGPPLLLPLELLDVELEDEDDDEPQLPLGGAWHLFVIELHHQPP
jgi:hypothetical protein